MVGGRGRDRVEVGEPRRREDCTALTATRSVRAVDGLRELVERHEPHLHAARLLGEQREQQRGEVLARRRARARRGSSDAATTPTNGDTCGPIATSAAATPCRRAQLARERPTERPSRRSRCGRGATRPRRPAPPPTRAAAAARRRRCSGRCPPARRAAARQRPSISSADAPRCCARRACAAESVDARRHPERSPGARPARLHRPADLAAQPERVALACPRRRGGCRSTTDPRVARVRAARRRRRDGQAARCPSRPSRSGRELRRRASRWPEGEPRDLRRRGDVGVGVSVGVACRGRRGEGVAVPAWAGTESASAPARSATTRCALPARRRRCTVTTRVDACRAADTRTSACARRCPRRRWRRPRRRSKSRLATESRRGPWTPRRRGVTVWPRAARERA